MTQPVAVFAAADDQYVPKAVMALRSFQRWHSDWSYFLLATKAALSQESLAFIQRYNIELLDVDETHRFLKQGRNKHNYPLETIYKLKGPELVFQRGFTYSIGIDGDVFCARPLEIENLLGTIEGYAGVAVGDFGRTLGNKQREQNEEFDFSLERVRDTLGVDEVALSTTYEVNGGVLFWNNVAMAKLGLFDKVHQVFRQCQGCFEGGQDLMTFTAAVHDIPFMELGDSLNFSFFEDASVRLNNELREEVRRGEFQRIYIVHFVYCKPWLRPNHPTVVKAHFINAWRQFVVDELGDKAYELFDDLSVVRPVSLAYRLWTRVSYVNRVWWYRAKVAWATVRGRPFSSWPRLLRELWRERGSGATASYWQE